MSLKRNYANIRNSRKQDSFQYRRFVRTPFKDILQYRIFAHKLSGKALRGRQHNDHQGKAQRVALCLLFATPVSLRVLLHLNHLIESEGDKKVRAMQSQINQNFPAARYL